MKKALVVALVTLVMSGCASYGDYGGGSRYSQGREVLPGMNAQGTGTLFGGLVGAIVGDALGLNGPQQALSILGGATAGAMFGNQYDEVARQTGRTNCTWRSSGSVDPSGMPQQSRGYYDCRGGNSAYGHRNYPPRAYSQ